MAYITELTEMLQVKHHAAGMLIDRCESAGWLVRNSDPKDRCQVRVSLTPSGEEVLS